LVTTVGSLASGAIELRRLFDRSRWQVASGGPPSGSTVLLAWTVLPDPVDAGIPPAIRAVVAEALCDLGPCWFAADEGDGSPVATLVLRRRLARGKALIFRADRAEELRAAFESGSHDWSMGAQWIVVGAKSAPSGDRILPVLRSLLETWELPVGWPADVSAIIQAGVDGDAAGCHCRTQEIERELRDALERRATLHGIDFRMID
jgi:hypothetical protein